MQEKPIFFNFMPILFILMALSLPLQICIMYNIPIWHIESIFSKLTPANLLLIGMFLWTAFFIYKIDPNLFILLPFLNLIVFVNNYIVGSYGQDYNLVETTIASSLFLFLSMSFYTRNIYKVINDIKYRWWLSKPRVNVGIPIVIITSKEKIHTKSFDLSETGLFALNDPNFNVFQISRDNEIELELCLKDERIQCRGRVVRKCLSKGKYPEGVGIQFSTSDQRLGDWINQIQAA